MSWQPTASIRVLKERAMLLKQLRDFFYTRDVLEVETPLLAHATVTDVHIESFVTHAAPSAGFPQLYLQTSPEYAMKRLLAAGSGSIFQICKAFRCEETGALHNPEFTMLEWYRVGFDHHALMDELDELLQLVLNTKPTERFSYLEIFQKYLTINPHQTNIEELRKCLSERHIDCLGELQLDDCLNLLMMHVIEPNLQAPTFIYDYPVSQAALARINNGVAERFELYCQGVELANGFHELSDTAEQQKRFQTDLLERRARGLSQPNIDQPFLEALAHGLPDCSGVALGLDRLLMLQLGKPNIKEVLSFPV